MPMPIAVTTDNPELFQSVREMFDLHLADITDDVDCSGSTLVYRNQRVGEIEDAWGAQGPLLHAVIAHLASYIAPEIGYASGAPYPREE